ncbi:MAG: class I SAM-dependent methyltransferase, partial [Nocardioides sp.]
MTARGAERTAVVWDALAVALGSQTPLDVLDIGGGTGGSAVTIAQMGHRVTVVDPSPDALAALDRRARERGVDVRAQQGDIASLGVEPASFDVVLCHGVLEVVEDPAASVDALRQTLRPGGTLSLLVAQRHSAVIARAMLGHFVEARALLDNVERGGRTGRRFTAEELRSLVAEAGLEPGQVHGVRTFVDLVPGALIDAESGSTAALVDLERAVAARPEFWPLAAQ